MIDRRELLLLAENLGLQPQVVEKDYVLGWLLAGIRANVDLGDHWVFKGGTCLKKCYFETYRFSEDLDFTITNEAHLDQAFLTKTFSDISGWIYEQTGLEIPAERLRFDVFQNKRNRLACEGRIYYRGPIAPRGGDLPRIKLDLTTDELLALPPVERPVVHSFSDEPEGGMKARCYAYEEVFGEKVRALGERARPRDLYDVVNLFRHEEFQPQPAAILDVLKRKCVYKSIQLPTLETIRAFYEELSGDWQTMLAHQLPALPPARILLGCSAGVFRLAGRRCTPRHAAILSSRSWSNNSATASRHILWCRRSLVRPGNHPVRGSKPSHRRNRLCEGERRADDAGNRGLLASAHEGRQYRAVCLRYAETGPHPQLSDRSHTWRTRDRADICAKVFDRTHTGRNAINSADGANGSALLAIWTLRKHSRRPA